ncbi:MAG: tRNA (guanine(10)-N(2))-dimethyltransferase [Thermoprotei archaeon]|nr:MAG: tRNA (guanine(10)-N(2))-dimethyltransferase [Thermoprotei archaeon]RLF23322.1 MAG: tRNA (guanine(10)-N(2))-dimethyltransferase [Thermoprotei archaeon]
MPTPKIPLRLHREGMVKLVLPDREVLGDEVARKIVFYNDVMVFSRDFSICALEAFSKLKSQRLRIAEPLTASGIRGLRYAKEVEGSDEVLICDVNPIAISFAELNTLLNGLNNKVVVQLGDANKVLSSHSSKDLRFSVTDIDPFGSPAPYVDSAIRATRIGGLIAVTATDMPPLCGVYPEVALRKYGGLSIRTEYCHEVAVRLVLGLLCREAGKYDLTIKPLTCHSTMHYVRVFVELDKHYRGLHTEHMGFIAHCFQCLHRELLAFKDLRRTTCPICGKSMSIAGPLWIGPLFNKEFCAEMLKILYRKNLPTKRQLAKTLSLILEECEGPPTYFTIDVISSRFKLKQPKVRLLVDELSARGFEATVTHFNPKAVRFNGRLEELCKTIQTISQST